MTTLTSNNQMATISPKNLAQNAEPLRSTLATYETDRWVGEPKLDGWRLLVHIASDGPHIYTRNAKCHDGSLPGIEQELSALPEGTWLDGEAVALTVKDGVLRHEWGTVQSVLGSSTAKAAALSDRITFMAFDLISYQGMDIRRLPYTKRREALERVYTAHDFTRSLIVPQVSVGDDSLDALLAQGFEGMMVKDSTAPYASGKRGAGWVKVKPQDTLDVVVTGFKPGENGFTGMVGAVEFGLYDGDTLVEVGRCSGMTMPIREQMTQHPDRWLGSVIEIKHMGQMPSGAYRHPQFKRKRDDKDPNECRLEES